MLYIHEVANTTAEALITSKLIQADATNQHHAAERPYTIRGHVYLSTVHHRHNFKAAGQTCVAKFMPHFNGPYVITHMILERSVYSLDIPNTYPNACLSFHASLLCPYFPSDLLLFPHWYLPCPSPVVMIDGVSEWEVQEIVDKQWHGHRLQYLVHWKGWGAEDEHWIPSSKLVECSILNTWLKHSA